MALQQAREYALNAISKASAQVSDALKQASGPTVPHAVTVPSDQPSVSSSMSSVTSGLVSSLTTALSNSSLLRQSTGGESGTSMSAVAEPESVRLQRIKQELAGSCINVHALKRLAFHGIPDRGNLRGLIWKAGFISSACENMPIHPSVSDISLPFPAAVTRLPTSWSRVLERDARKAPDPVSRILRCECLETGSMACLCLMNSISSTFFQYALYL